MTTKTLALAAVALLGGCKTMASMSLEPTVGADGRIGVGVHVDLALKGARLTLDAWRRFAEATGGATYESKVDRDMPDLVGRAMRDGLAPGPVDIVFVVDTTGSMQDDIDAVKEKLSEIVDRLAATNPDYAFGVATYRDTGDDYVSKTVQPLTHDKGAILAGIAALHAAGGGDWREHVYAGLDTGLREQPWRAGAAHRIILVGDAPPHESYASDPRNFDSVIATARERRVRIDAIAASCDAGCQILVSTLDGVLGGKP